MFPNAAIIHVFLGCCASAFLMEILMSRAPQCSILITFLQFFFIFLQGLISLLSKFKVVKPKIPLRNYAILVALFFVTSVANNYVYSLHVPSTLHMIIRSASTPTSMLVTWYAKKRVPKLKSVIGSILISVGVAVALCGGATVAEKNKGHFFYWCIGVFILISTLLAGAITGLQQELLYAKYGKHPEEMMFYTHALPLPFFIFMYPQIVDTGFGLPYETWILIFINIISQFYCVYSVHKLSTKKTSISVTFILTVRKFLSILISSVVFKNNLTILHVIGTIFVVIGTCVYFEFFKGYQQKPVSLTEKK